MSGGAILEDGDGIELVQKFDAQTGHWTETTGMLIPRSGSAACFLNGFIYVIGKEVVFSVDLVCKEELNLMLVCSSQGAVGLS